MPILKESKFQRPDGAECIISLSLNDAAIMQDSLELEVEGKFREHPSEEWIACKFVARLNIEINSIEIEKDGRVVGTINLSDTTDFFAEEFDEISNSETWERVSRLFPDGSEAIEEAIDSIPVPDPIIGCLIRAGLSTTIGQLIECNSAVTRRDSRKRRVWELLRCLGHNSLVMISKFSLRTGRCALSCGWF